MHLWGTPAGLREDPMTPLCFDLNAMGFTMTISRPNWPPAADGDVVMCKTVLSIFNIKKPNEESILKSTEAVLMACSAPILTNTVISFFSVYRHFSLFSGSFPLKFNSTQTSILIGDETLDRVIQHLRQNGSIYNQPKADSY